jgi:hypothetical protein
MSVIWAALLYQAGVPGAWLPFLRNGARLIPIALLVAVLSVLWGPRLGISLAIVAVSVMEFSFRNRKWRGVADTAVLWLYLAIGIKIAFGFSSVVVSLKPCTEFDSALNRLDSRLMFGWTVVHLSQMSAPLYSIASEIYYSIFGIMGAGIAFLCLAGDRGYAARLSGAILTAYFISLVVFFFVPAQGPFLSNPMPSGSFTSALQAMSLTNARFLYHHSSWITPPSAYYVAFPSLHVAQPLIVAWFLRRWRRVSGVLFGYCALLIPSIIILRWHYLVDILGGILVATIAVAIVSMHAERRSEQTPAV